MQRCSHNVCTFYNLSFTDFKIVNLINISIKMREACCITFD